MRSKGWMLLTVLLLVALPLGALAVASTQQQMPLPVTAAMHHHYFEVGYRQCEGAIKKAEAQAPAGQAVAVAIAITTDEYPEEFRQDVSAGCQTASG